MANTERKFDQCEMCPELSKIDTFKEMANNGKFIEAIDGLLSLEKQFRTVRTSFPFQSIDIFDGI